MRLLSLKFCSLLCFAVTVSGVTQPIFAGNIDDVATHKQAGLIKINDKDNPLPINSFCLNHEGQIVAACGQGPGQIRLIDDQGEILASWDLTVKPEAVAVAEDGSILAGGEGKLFRFSSEGKLLHESDSPHAKALRENSGELRKQAVARLSRSNMTLASRITAYEGIIKQLEAKSEKQELNKQEERMLEILPEMLAKFQKQAAEEAEKAKEDEGPSEEAISAQVENMLRMKMRISSISSCGQNVFVTTSSMEGYGFCVWKMNAAFDEGTPVVDGLRGCCGQMDVQCCKDGLFVAENGRHRVVSYDQDGNELKAWGETDRTGIEGFSSCCNPMNVCFGADGDVFTAEASTGRIKRFKTNGEFVSYVGDVELVPGCKNVSIAVSPDAQKVYMLDLTRNHIVVMQARPESELIKDLTGEESKETASQLDSGGENFGAALAKALLPVFGG